MKPHHSWTVRALAALIGVLPLTPAFGSNTTSGQSFGTGTPSANTLVAPPDCNVVVGTVTYPGIRELSGIANSRINANVVWVENDSYGRSGGVTFPEDTYLYAFKTDGTFIRRYRIKMDGIAGLEDICIGVGPTAGQSYLYAGNVGGTATHTVEIYRLPEPDVFADSGDTVDATGVTDEIDVTYPGTQSPNCETLMIDPEENIYTITKSTNATAAVWGVHPPTGGHFAAGGSYNWTQVATVNAVHTTNSNFTGIINGINAGDISSDGNLIVIKNLCEAMLYFTLPSTAGLGNSWSRWAATFSPSSVTVADDTNMALTPPIVQSGDTFPGAESYSGYGEAIGFSADNLHYYTVQEGDSEHLYTFNRLAPATPSGFSVTSGSIGNGDGKLTVTWTASPELDRAGYTLQYKKASVDTWTNVPFISDPTITTKTVTGLNNASNYNFRIQAQNDGGLTSPWSAATSNAKP